jgi:membrane fusion protein, multidrug efflux system
MKRAYRATIIAVVVIALIAGAVYWYVIRSRSAGTTATETSPAPSGPMARVQVVPLRRQEIKETLVVYGTMVVALGEAETFSVPFESRVQSVLVTTGQVVGVNAAMVEITPSPDTLLKLAQARAEQATAQENLQLVQERLKLKLATQQDLVTAQQQRQAADLKVQSMEKSGIDGRQTIRATSKGLISRVDVEPGQIVAAGKTLVEIVGQDQISVRLGVETEDIGTLRLGQSVDLYPVNAPGKKATQGRITLITQSVNPKTRLVDVFVTPQNDVGLMRNEYLEAHVVLASDTGFVVPRSAVLPEQGSYILYTVRQGHAVRHVVSIGLETPTQVQVQANDLQEGEPVVTMGNYELREGMAVTVEPQK